MSGVPVLTIEDLRTYFYSMGKQAFIRSVDNVSLRIKKGETLGIVGESGSGKSMTSLSVMGLVDSEPGIITGRICFMAIDTQMLKSIAESLKMLPKRGNGVCLILRGPVPAAGSPPIVLCMRKKAGRRYAQILVPSHSFVTSAMPIRLHVISPTHKAPYFYRTCPITFYKFLKILLNK